MAWANLVINVLLVIGGASAFILYKMKINNEIRDSATMLVLQIDEVRNNVISIKQAMEAMAINEQGIFETNKLLLDNIWSKHKHLLINKIGQLDSASLNSFFQCVENIKIQQDNMKNFSMQYLYNNTQVYQSKYAEQYLSLFKEKNQHEVKSLLGADEKDDATSEQENSIKNISLEKIRLMAYDISLACLAPRTYMPTQFKNTMSKLISEYDGLSIEHAYSKLRRISKME